MVAFRRRHHLVRFALRPAARAFVPFDDVWRGRSSVAAGPAPGRAGPVALAAERRRLLWSTLLFVAGFSFVFALLEATASALFHPLQSHKPVLGDIAGGLIVAMGVVIAVQLPWLQREHRVAVQPSRLGPWVAPVMGMTFAFGWTPCITPVLAAVLGLASSGGTLARGEGMLVAYSLGLGVPFVVTGLAFGRLSGALRFARSHSRAISVVSGARAGGVGVAHYHGRGGHHLVVVIQRSSAHRPGQPGHWLKSCSHSSWALWRPGRAAR